MITKTFKDNAQHFFLELGTVAILVKDSFIASFTRPFYINKIIEQIIILGIGSISISIVIGLVMGSVMTLQFGFGMSKFGGTLYVPGVVALSLTREMAPLFTSLLVAGRIGSGMTAEIGSMNVTQQIDALRALGTSPIRVLVVPRLIASIISLPLLTAISNFVGLLGSLIISVTEFSIPVGYYINRVTNIVKLTDFNTGLLKTVFFAAIITFTACYKGFNTKDGTKGVGVSTTWVVVTSSILILITDFFLSKLFLIIFSK